MRNLFFFLIALLAAAWLFFQSETVRIRSAAAIENAIFNATGLHIEMDQMAFSFPKTLTAHSIRVKDSADKLLLEAEQAEFSADITLTNFTVALQNAKLYFLPKDLPKSDSSSSTRIALFVDQLEVEPDVFNDIELPTAFKLNHVSLNHLTFVASTQQLSGEAYVEGLLKDKILNVQTTFQRQEGNVKASFQAIYDAVLPVNGIVHLSSDMQLDGTSLHIPEVAFANDVYTGTLQADARLYGSVETPLLDLEIQSPTCVVKGIECKDFFGHVITALSEKEAAGQIHLASFIDEKELFFNTDFNYLFGESLTLSSSELVFGDLMLMDLSAKFPSNSRFYINGEGIWKQSPIAFTAKGFWDQPKLTIDAFGKIDENEAMGSFSYTPEEVRGTFELNNFALSTLPLNQPLTGSISLKGNLSGPPSDPRVQLALSSHALQIEEKTSQFDLRAIIEKGHFSSQGAFTLSHLPSVKFDIQFPLTFSLNPWILDVNKESPLSGHVTAEGEISQILHHVLDNPTSLSGHTKIVVNLAGTLQQPQWNGIIGINQGIYEIPEIGVLLKDLNAAIDIHGTRLVITQISATDGKSGRVYGSGYYDIDKEKQYPFVLELNLQQAAFLNQDNAKIICNGPLSFKGNTKEGTLSGQLQIEDGTITIPERSYSTINTVDVTYINVPSETTNPQCTIEKKAPWPLTLDIHLTCPRTLTIEGKDLASNWKGEIAVQGQGNAPQLFGELRVSDGQYLFNGNPFAINQGTITFAGDIDKKTTLYVIAERDLDKVKVDVIVKGPVKKPAISFRSNPPMPQREILSWLLFNRGTSQISPFQGAQLSESITNLSTSQQGPDVLSKIRSTFKIDRFEIGRGDSCNENTGVNLEVGKYISDNILISVIKSDVNKIAIEANLTDRIKLQGQVGDDSQGKLLLKWKRDY